MNKYYAVLGLSTTATKDEIRRKYRQLVLIWHPDRNSSPEAHDKFISITEAYDVLMGERKAPGTNYTSRPGTAYSSPRPRAKTAYERGQENINRIHENRKRKLRDLREQYCDPLHAEKNKRDMYFQAWAYFTGAGLLVLAALIIPIASGHLAHLIWTVGPAVGFGMRLVWNGGRIKLRADMIFSGREDYSFEDLKEFFRNDTGVRFPSGGRGGWSR